jgi:hypothetical protein
MGQRSRAFGEQRFNSRKNAHAIGDMIVDAVHARTGEARAAHEGVAA